MNATTLHTTTLTTTLHAVTSTAPDPGGGESPASLRVVAWEEPVPCPAGIDPRAPYTETFWLPVLGPSATWLLRRLADGLDASPGGFDLPLEETARSLGLGGMGSRHSPFQRALLRCARYGIARKTGLDVLAVRRRLAPLPRRYVLRLPPSLRLEHDRWEAARRTPPTLPDVRRRARAVALDLVTAAESAFEVERRLLGWGIHPALAHESAMWAWARHAMAASAVALTVTGVPPRTAPGDA